MVECFMRFPDAAGAFRSQLREAPDCERLLPKVRVLGFLFSFHSPPAYLPMCLLVHPEVLLWLADSVYGGSHAWTMSRKHWP